MCTVLLPPDCYPIAITKYINKHYEYSTQISLPIYTAATSKIPRPLPRPRTLGDAIDNLCNEKRHSYRGKYKTAPDGKVVPVPNYALATASGAVPPRITSALDHCQRSPSCPKKRFLRHAANRKLVGGETASYP
jgi:hypothetical protein